jgi:hypothetical protein
MKIKEIRQAEAEVRQEERAKRTNAQQIAKLDAKFGKGNGAKKERKRLSK